MKTSRFVKSIFLVFLFFSIPTITQAIAGDIRKDSRIEVARGLYQSYSTQYSQCMLSLGYYRINGFWERTDPPGLSEIQKTILLKRKEILVDAFKLIQVYEAGIGRGIGQERANELTFEILAKLMLAESLI